MNLTLYYTPIACSLVPYIALTEADVRFGVKPINMQNGQHLTQEYLRLNPKHRVPVLVIDGEPLTENVAIQIWIARNFPQAKLLPTDPMQEIKAISFLAWCASGIHPTLTPNALPQRYCDLPDSADSVRRCAQKLLLENYQVADDLLAGREWFFDHFTTADIYFFWCFRRGTIFKVDVSPFKNCLAHFERMQQRASVQKLLAFEKGVLAEFAAS
ncbi:MAG: glutathione S-transferase family protein [Steroidobacteraceae bacterium]